MTFRHPLFRLPASLAGQIVILVLTGTLVSQLVMILLFTDERRTIARDAVEERVARRMAEAVRLTRSLDPALQDTLLRSLSDRRLRVSSRPAPDRLVAMTRPDRAFAQTLTAQLAETGVTAEAVAARRGLFDPSEQIGRPRRRPRRGTVIVLMEVSFGPGDRVTGIVYLPRHPPRPGGIIVLVSTVTALILTGIMVWLARRITRPLAALGEAADRLGTGRSHESLPEQGPQEVRRAVSAFNRMGRRLDGVLEDQRRMVAAVGHDLRTPITALRLRTEFVEDTENRHRMARILDEMQTMADGLVALTRADAEDEAVRPTDLAALVDSIADAMADLGMAVETGAPQIVYPCRPGALTRAVRNLAENAVRYGGAARIAIAPQVDRGVAITVDDDGPGLPEEALERVFEPFTRLESSRNAQTGGLGLGLPVARMMVQKHGGTVTLRNRPEGGLQARILLPPVLA